MKKWITKWITKEQAKEYFIMLALYSACFALISWFFGAGLVAMGISGVVAPGAWHRKVVIAVLQASCRE